MLWIGRLRGARSSSLGEQFLRFLKNDLSWFNPIFLLFDTRKSCVFQLFLLTSIKTYMCPNIIIPRIHVVYKEVLYKLLFSRGFYFREFREPDPHENFHFNSCLFIVMTTIRKITKLTTRELPHLVQKRETNGLIQYIGISVSLVGRSVAILRRELLPQFFTNSHEIWHRCLPWGVDVQDTFFDSGRKCVAMVTAYGKNGKNLASRTTSSVFHQFSWNLAQMFVLGCRCARHIFFYTAQKVCCHGNGILWQKWENLASPITSSVFHQFSWNLAQMFALGCRCARLIFLTVAESVLPW